MLGFPLVPKEDYEVCGVTGLSKACSESRMFPVSVSPNVANQLSEIIEMMQSALPIREPYDQPVYSTVAFSLLALALSGNENGKTYEQLLNEVVITPLGLSNTGVSPGNTEKAVIPPLSEDKQGWGADYGFIAP